MAGTLINTLRNPDGSATHTALGYTVIASVNGPIEVSRRDELPEEATLEVNLSTATGAACMYRIPTGDIPPLTSS